MDRLYTHIYIYNRTGWRGRPSKLDKIWVKCFSCFSNTTIVVHAPKRTLSIIFQICFRLVERSFSLRLRKESVHDVSDTIRYRSCSSTRREKPKQKSAASSERRNLRKMISLLTVFARPRATCSKKTDVQFKNLREIYFGRGVLGDAILFRNTYNINTCTSFFAAGSTYWKATAALSA